MMVDFFLLSYLVVRAREQKTKATKAAKACLVNPGEGGVALLPPISAFNQILPSTRFGTILSLRNLPD